MGTKLRKASYSAITKAVAFLLAIICFGLAVTIFEDLLKNSEGLEPLFEHDYVNTRELFNYQQNFHVELINLLRYKNEEYIKQGNLIDKNEFENRKRTEFYGWYDRLTINNQINQNPLGNTDSGTDIYKQLKEKFETENADRIKEIYDSMINEELRSYYYLIQTVNSKKGLYFYATDGENTYTNCEQTERQYYTRFKAYYVFDQNGLEFGPAVKDNNNAYLNNDLAIGNKIYIAVADQFITNKQAEWERQYIYLKNGITAIICLAFLLLAAVLYLMWRTGKKENSENVHLIAIDRLYTDLNIAFVLCFALIWVAMSSLIIRGDFHRTIRNELPIFGLMALFNAIFFIIELTLLLSLSRHTKNRTLISHSLFYKIFMKLVNIIKAVINSGPLPVRIAAIILISEIVVIAVSIRISSIHSHFAPLWLVILIAISIVGIYYVVLKIRPFTDIVRGVHEIRKGKLEHVITVPGNGDLAKLARDINDIADGLKDAVEKEIKAERMKTDLVTNVSHDLKTPLTSIINYVDLLSKEKLTPDEANDYVAVLKQKSEKLKQLTQDLFEISKIQSGNISVDMGKLDISVLLKQSLAEFDEQISSSGLAFKVNIRDGNTFIIADGKLISRVFENLISNILKYSLANTRVYIDVFADEGSIFIEFKNIADYEMNFREDEILERFVRGDKSRSIEGHGLGLAIAQSYVAACRGSLHIRIDGDLFKVTIKFDKA